MTFAWVLALPCGKRVATCAGPVFGFRQSSYRSEGYKVLSAVRFVYHLFKFCGCAPQWRYNYMADNKGLLTALTQDATYAEAFPNTTLEDVLIHLVTLKDIKTVVQAWSPSIFLHN
jgi:hypothetical protein